MSTLVSGQYVEIMPLDGPHLGVDSGLDLIRSGRALRIGVLVGSSVDYTGFPTLVAVHDGDEAGDLFVAAWKPPYRPPGGVDRLAGWYCGPDEEDLVLADKYYKY